MTFKFSKYFTLTLVLSCIAFLDAGNIRLEADTRGAVAGLVQVYHNGEWGTICDNSWGTGDGNVACIQLGFSKYLNTWGGGQGEGRVWLDDMACTGSEASLQDCTHAGWGIVSSNCKGHTEDVIVMCSGRTGNPAPNIRFLPAVSGIVQVKYQNQWGTVCHDFWGMNDAKVACRQLGFTKTVEYKVLFKSKSER